jgi:4-amino-4-deoxy-L-arabinose transferase-like glycosyltransferase
MWDRRDSLVAFLLGVVSLLLFLQYRDYGINDDEGYLLGGVTRILEGEVPYRDFHHTYAPGRFYLVALLFRIFGEDLLVVRGLWVVLRVLIVCLAYLAGRRILSRPGAVAASLFFLLAPGPWHKSFFHLFLLANLFALMGLPGRRARDAVPAGLLAGATFLFRQDLGVFVFLVYGLLLLLGRRTGENAGRGAAFFLSGAAAILPFVLYFAAEGALSAAASKVLLAGMRDNRTNALPFPNLFHPISGGVSGLAFLLLRLLYYVPVPLALLAGARGARGLLLGRPDGRPLLVLSLLGLLSFNQALWRSDLAHLFQAVGAAYLLLPWALERIAPRSAPARAALLWASPVLLLLAIHVYADAYRSPRERPRIAAEGLQPIPPYYTGSIAQMGGRVERLALRKARVCVPPEEARSLDAIGKVLDRYSSPGDYVLTVPGFQMIYFLFDRANPTSFIHLRRGFDAPAEEEAYIRDLLDRPTKLVLLRDVPLDGREERRFRNYAPRVFEAIEREFEPVERLGDLIVYRRAEVER